MLKPNAQIMQSREDLMVLTSSKNVFLLLVTVFFSFSSFFFFRNAIQYFVKISLQAQ